MQSKPIPFTQYLRPDGRRKEISISRPPAIATKAQAIIAAGYRFECEVLNVPPGFQNISLTITGDKGDVAIELCRNGPEVGPAVDKLITEFNP